MENAKTEMGKDPIKDNPSSKTETKKSVNTAIIYNKNVIGLFMKKINSPTKPPFVSIV